MQWSVKHDGQAIIESSALGLQLQSGEVLGANPKISSSKLEKVKKEITANLVLERI